MDLTSLPKLLQDAQPELLALDAYLVTRSRIDRERAVELTHLVQHGFAPYLPQLAEIFSPKQTLTIQAALDRVELRGYVFYAASLDAQAPWTSERKQRYQELRPKVREHDQIFIRWLWALFQDDPQLRSELKDIRLHHGVRDDVEDVIREVKLIRAHWPRITGRAPLTIEQVDQADHDAAELLSLLDLDDDRVLGSPGDLRNRAYTLWAEDYELLAHTGRYLARLEADTEARFPLIHSTRKPTRAAAPAPA